VRSKAKVAEAKVAKAEVEEEEEDWRALYWPDYVVLTVLTTSLSV
jgi:hypothetical protein